MVSPTGTAHLLTVVGNEPINVTGVHVNIYNNLWGTAFPQVQRGARALRHARRVLTTNLATQWYDDDAVFRFRVQPTRRQKSA